MLSASRFGGSQTLHVFAGERLQAFSDAVFAIIATLMVIPLKLGRDEVEAQGGIEGFKLENFFIDQWPHYLVYLYSFTLVVDMWYSHVGIFSIVEQVDDVIIWLNLLCLLLVSFLPYGIGLVSAFPTSIEGEHISIFICALDMLFIGITMFLILLYVFRRQSLLHPEIENNQDIVSIRRASVISVLITPCMSLLALCFSFLTQAQFISQLLFYSISTTSFVARLAVFLYYKYKKKVDHLPCHLFNSVGSTIRTEAFSDGLFSIVATLLVLDLTTEGIPTQQEVDDNHGGSLRKALDSQRFVVVAYITSFMVVGLLWFVHYGMMHFITALTPTLSFVNNTTLVLIGGIPFVSGVDTIFSDLSVDSSTGSGRILNKAIAIRALCALVFLVGVGQLLFWTMAHFQKETCMSPSVNKSRSEALQISKIMVFPIISIITFWGTFSEDFVYYGGYNYLLFSTPFIFLLLKVIFKRHDLALKIVKVKLKNLQDKKHVNATTGERTALIGGSDEVPTTSTHMRLVGKGEEVVQVDEVPTTTHMRLIGKGQEVVQVDEVPTTTHMRLVGKGEEVDVEVISDSSAR